MSEHLESGPRRPTVHWVGTGLSTGSGLRQLADAGPVVLWGRSLSRAKACADRIGLPASARLATLGGDTAASLGAALVPGDVVVSMLPATEHLALLRLAISRGAHFASSSYTTPQIRDLADEARSAGLVVLTEAGLDPGLDHLFAHALMGEARAALGDGPATMSLTSWCGGVPAVPNDFRYRFSWAPAGVLTALLQPARYVEDGDVTTVALPWVAVREHVVPGADDGGRAQRFEAYPNRDSIGFVEQYGVPPTWRIETFVRGTLRLTGWSAAWQPVFDALVEHGADGVDELAADLAARYPTTAEDRDRVVLDVALDVVTPDRARYHGRRLVDLVGDATESAMAALVSRPLAVGVSRLLDGRLRPGLHRAAETVDDAAAWLDALTADGLVVHTTTVAPDARAVTV